MIKTILVHLRGTAGDTATLKAAVEVARLFEAHLECIHIRRDLASLISEAAVGDTGDDTDTVTAVLRRLEAEGAAQARRAAETFAAIGLAAAEEPPGPGRMSGTFTDSSGNELEQLAMHSRYHDLLVVKAADDGAGSLSVNDLGHLIARSGRPVLLAPSVPAKPLHNIVIAWKDVPEAARAVTAAMPLLAKARSVFVASATEEDSPPSDCEAAARQLRWHGIAAQSHRIEPGDRDASHALLEMARAAGADLLVMGAYGHSRVAETILGGFTQSVLEDASLPVLMLH